MSITAVLPRTVPLAIPATCTKAVVPSVARADIPSLLPRCTQVHRVHCGRKRSCYCESSSMRHRRPLCPHLLREGLLSSIFTFATNEEPGCNAHRVQPLALPFPTNSLVEHVSVSHYLVTSLPYHLIPPCTCDTSSSPLAYLPRIRRHSYHLLHPGHNICFPSPLLHTLNLVLALTLCIHLHGPNPLQYLYSHAYPDICTYPAISLVLV
ncbi:hypothetical protein BV20DRAFT_1099685 [Pilatotrama ljubarskyi]|nr:hypothetical protein BV20DRAFT_1099685 [Pilatotrama ljubarskyi]